MRELTLEIGKAELDVACTFGAAEKVAEKISDPLFMWKELVIEQELASQGVPYDAKFRWTVANVPIILHIGHKEAGGKKSLDDIKALVFDAGYVESRDAATLFLSKLVSPRDIEMEAKEGDAPGE